MTAIEDIKNRLDIVDLISETVKLRKAGKNMTGFCPFHPNTRTPAFVVFPESGTWRCFGQCNEGGDIFKFVMKKEGWDFPQTLRYLAERAGVQLQPFSEEQQEKAEEHERLRNLLEEAVVFYRHQLFHTPAGQQALEYLHHRQLRDETIETFGLGYAPQAWEAALQHFSAKGYTPEELLQVGLVSERDSGGVYDRFRHRIIFPIRDPMGRMAGFGARILNPDDVPKFLNSPQTVLFDKGRLLYGLDQARKAIRANDQVTIVEGYLDVIALHQGGFANSVSPMGTALTEDQLRMLKRFTRRIILALDADAAGARATLRGLEIARQTLERSADLTFDARGLLRYEARLQADLRVTVLPEGMDPDEVVNRDAAEWKRILEAARPIVIHVMETIAQGRDLDDPKVKSEIASRVLPLIEDIPDNVEREDYRQRLARMLQVDERALLPGRPSGGRRTRPAARQAQPPSPGPTARPSQALEDYCLGLLIQRPDILYMLDRSLQQAGLNRFSIQDFDHTDYQAVLRVIQDALEQEELEPRQYLQQHLPESLQELVQRLASPKDLVVVAENRLLEELVRAVMRLRLHRVNESLTQLKFLQEDMQEQGDLRATPYQNLVLQHMQARDRLDRALRQPLTRS
jgi:DNA primase